MDSDIYSCVDKINTYNVIRMNFLFFPIPVFVILSRIHINGYTRLNSALVLVYTKEFLVRPEQSSNPGALRLNNKLSNSHNNIAHLN